MFSPFAEWEAKMTVHWLRWVGGREQGLLEHRDQIEAGTYDFFCLMGTGLGVTSEPENYALAVFSRLFLSSQIRFWSKFYITNCISVWGGPEDWRSFTEMCIACYDVFQLETHQNKILLIQMFYLPEKSIQVCSQKPAVASCLYKSWEAELWASVEVKWSFITWLDLITFRQVNSLSSYTERLQAQTEHENSLNQLFWRIYLSQTYSWDFS